jgi:oligopeptidase B
MRTVTCLFLMCIAMPASEPAPPVAQTIPKKLVLHGDTRVDPYFWLREKTNPDVIAYLEAENKYTESVMAPTQKLQDALYREILGRIQETDLTVPAVQGRYLYYTRTEQGKQYTIHCRKPVGTESEEILLDENELAKGHKYFRMEAARPSVNQQLLAYSVDTLGDENYTIFVKNLSTAALLPDQVSGNHGSIVWANDNKTYFYVTLDAAKRPEKVWRHTLGSSNSEDQLLFHEKDERFFVTIAKTRSNQFVLINLRSKNTTEVHYLAAGDPNGEFRIIHPREPELEYSVQDQGDVFFIRTNDAAKNFRLMKVPIADPAKKNWREIVAHRADVKLEGMDTFRNHLVLYERENGLLKLRVQNTATNETHYVSFQEPAYSVAALDNFEYDTEILRFRYTSLVTPPSVYDYNMSTRSRELRKREEVRGGYDPTQYVSERIFATAKDGARIPVSLVYRKGTKKDGNAPLLLYAYGSYGLNSEAAFASSRLSLLDRGFIYAIANIRGGSELGEAWHDQGKMMAKRNTFTDFIAAAEHLIAQKYTSSARLAIQGGSAGGLLMGSVVNLRPDLFHAVIAKVPFVDVLNTMLDASLPLTVTEYEEWGNPNEEAAYRYMRTYSPYDNVEKKAYPNILITAGLNDPRVSYWEPAKWTAKLRAMKTDKNLLLLKTNMGSGHFGSSGRYERIKETALDYAFLLKTLGMAE